jgi:hypothetical protein
MRTKRSPLIALPKSDPRGQPFISDETSDDLSPIPLVYWGLIDSYNLCDQGVDDECILGKNRRDILACHYKCVMTSITNTPGNPANRHLAKTNPLAWRNHQDERY